MSNRITLYSNCKILPWKNFSVDDVSAYLETIEFQTFNNIQYFKHSLNLTYKLELPRGELDFKLNPGILGSHNINYLKVQNDTNPLPGGAIVYYFVLDKKWISNTCIEFTLEMDVLNTFKNIQLSEKTEILRQHKDRWVGGTSPELVRPLLDFYNEGINPSLFKTYEKTLYNLIVPTIPQVYDFDNWYLIYRSVNAGSDQAIDIFLCSDDGFDVDLGSSGWNGTLNPAKEFKGQKGGIIYGADGLNNFTNVGCVIKFKNSDGNNITFTFTSANQCVLIGRGYIQIGYVDSNGFQMTSTHHGNIFGTFRSVQITGLQIMRICTKKEVYYMANWSHLTASYITGLDYYTDYVAPSGQYKELGSIIDIDRTDGQLLKIVKLPYCPIPLTKEGDYYVLPSGWEVARYLGTGVPADFYLLKYRNTRNPECFINTITLDSENYDVEDPTSFLAQRVISNFGDLVAKNPNYEVKLYHSEFFTQKYVYDSFTYELKLENCKQYVDLGSALVFNFYVSSAVSSAFMFRLANDLYRIDTEDYTNVMYVSRNNELPIYNSAYLDYIRTGYNYDLKTRNRTLATNIASLGLGFVSNVAGFVSNKGKRTNAQNTSGAIQLVASTLDKTINVIASTKQADQNIEERLKMSTLQGVSVSGADDLGLVSAYTENNKMKLVRYELSAKMKECIFDLFYYCGYIANYQGVPDTTSRMLFNFVQADIVLDTTPNLPLEIVNKIVEKYHEGITFLHHYSTTDSGGHSVSGWDFEQQYENWETALL